MNISAMQEATRDAVKAKFGRKKYLASRTQVRYPQNLEREYIRVTNAYMKLLNVTLAEYAPEIKAILTKSQDGFSIDSVGGMNADAGQNYSRMIQRVLDRAEIDLQKKTADFDLIRKLNDLENRARKHSVSEWKRVVRQTLGIDIFSDYYKGAYFRANAGKWVQQNVNLIKKMPADTLGNMRQIILRGYTSGATNKTITEQVMNLNPRDFGFKPEMTLEAYNDAMGEYLKAKRHAQFIARDQMAKLNADITQQQQTDAGVSEYVWRTVGDGRVRDSHKHLNNKRFRYDDPPVVDDETGRRANPGEDYQCRCVALPVFDIDTVVLPWEKSE
ncbi:hypothetical protein FACS1894202_12370 [Clostridia bacterium]|nr:hypothetical protein FACS1894202_12370 [Clostridia bacterium]